MGLETVVYEWEMDKALKRFLAKVVDYSSKEECWIWTAHMIRGYGQFRYKDKLWLAHRWIYLYYFKDLEEKKVIDHLCGNRACVNPYHLEEVSRSTNIVRGGSDHRT